MTIKKTIALIPFILIAFKSFSQIDSERRKGAFNLNYKFNFTDDSKTKEYASNGHTVLISRTITLDRLLSVAPVLDYSYFEGYSTNHNFSLGADAIFYPLHLISLLKEEEYQQAKDNYSLSLGFYKTINKSNINSVFNLNFSVYTFPIYNQLKISPTIGASFYKQKEQDSSNLNFYNIGVNFRF